jgi:hypothetical protein
LRFRLKRKKKQKGEEGKTKKHTNGGQKDAGGDDRITSNDMPQSIGDTHCNDDDNENGDNFNLLLRTFYSSPRLATKVKLRQELDFVERERVLMLKTLAGILILKTFVPLKTS